MFKPILAALVLWGGAITTAGAAMQSSVTQYGITWTFSSEHRVGRYANGDYWVLGPVTITSITPDFDGTHNGWEIDPDQTSVQPYDSRAPGFDASLVPSLPVTVDGTKSILKSVSVDAAQVSPRPALQTAAVLTVVGEVPADDGADLFRPGYFGTAKLPFSTSQLRTDLLPRATTPPLTPAIADLAADFQRVQLDHKFESTCRYIHPASNMPDYGSSIAALNAQGVLRLLVDDTVEDKMPLLVNLVQYGIDLHAMFEGGQYWKGNGGHMVGRKLVMAFAALMLDDADMRDAVRNAGTYDFDENHGTFYSARAGRVLYGQLVQSENNYWMNATVDAGSRTIRDPYGWIDGGREPGGSYQFCCLSQPWKAQIVPVCMLPGLADIWNDTTLITYVDRWTEHGAWAQADPCAPAPAFDRSGDTSEKKALWYDTRADSGYGTTWGPAPDNDPDCYLTSTCDCIRDTDTTDGIGRFPDLDGYGKNQGTYGSTFADFMYGWYRDSVFVSTSVGDGSYAAGTVVPPALPNPVTYTGIIGRYPDARVYSFDGARMRLPRAGLALVRIPGYATTAVLIRD